MVRLTDRLDMTIVVDWDVKPQVKQTNKQTKRVMIDMFSSYQFTKH